MATRVVTTTIRPGEPVEVDDAEYLDLVRYGLVAGDAPAQAPIPVRSGATKSEERAK